MRVNILGVVGFAASVSAGKILWDGRFDASASSADLNKWSWATPVGPYQYYIHGKDPVENFVNLSPQFSNPADTKSKQGSKITISPKAKWNSDMWRTELIPQTNGSVAINKGKVFYHFSMKRTEKNKPSVKHEHQVCFFESHFTEMKYGWINGEQGNENPNLQWMVDQKSQWKTSWKAEEWHNIAYEIDFDTKSVSFWHSTGKDPLKATRGPVKANANSDGKDWHLGVLRLPRPGFDNSNPEDWYFSGIYVESGPITTSVTGP